MMTAPKRLQFLSVWLFLSVCPGLLIKFIGLGNTMIGIEPSKDIVFAPPKEANHLIKIKKYEKFKRCSTVNKRQS
jgi:hypothetical protein